jgi:hypothetical protein
MPSRSHRFFTAVFTILSIDLLIPHSMSAQSPAHSPTTEHLQLGRSAIPLYGPWKFSIGDSPLNPSTGQPLWADPSFDDSHWEDVDLTPDSGALNPISGVAGYVPGWTTRGHAGYWGYAWYRLRLQIDTATNVQLAIAGPQIDDVYQFFDNGAMVGHFGDFNSDPPQIFYAQPVMFPLPPSPNGTRLLAVRVWMQPATLYQGSTVGGIVSAPTIGEASTIALVQHLHVDEITRAYLWQPIEALLLGLLGLLALSLSLFDRSDRVYLWIGGLLLLAAIDATSGSFATWSTLIHARYDVISHDFVLFALEYAGWVMIWRVWFRQRRPAWLPWALIPMTIILGISQALAENFFPALAASQFTTIGHFVSLLVRLLMASFLLLIVVQAIRDQGVEGWLALPPVLLASSAEFSHELQQLGLRVTWFPFGVQMNLAVASRLLLILVLTILLVRRLVLSIRRQRLMVLDFKQAQEVQRVILPQSHTLIPGLQIETEYRPARQVGGDFFQIIPHPADGSVLIVVGDVAGKGLQAGMLVALLIGAIRSTAEATSEPLELLQALNRRLLGRGEAYATCLAIRISSQGHITLANAGHLPPYLNGEPVQLEGSLPLGAMDGAEFSVTYLQLNSSDKLFLTTDGLAEAMNPEGQLFGFTRVQQLVKAGKTASDIADTIQLYGQEDDISIVSLTRTPAIA